MLGINSRFEVAQLALQWLCSGVASSWVSGFVTRGPSRPPTRSDAGSFAEFSAEGCASLRPSASFYLLIPLNIHQ